MHKREPGIDLIRCLGLLFVNGIHAFYFNGYYFQPQTTGVILVADGFRWLFFCANGIFMMLTGYLKTSQPLSKRYFHSLLPILVSYAIASAISIPIRHFYCNDAQSLEVWFSRFITFFGVNYGWYIEMYVGLLLFSPVLNLAMDALEKRKHGLLWLAGIMVFLTALPSATELAVAPDYWTGLYPLTFYVIGAVIRRLQPNFKSWLCLLGALLVSFGLGFVTWITTDEGASKGFGQGYGGFWVTVITTLLFLGLYRARPGKPVSRVLAWAAGGVFEGYMLSHLLDFWVYGEAKALQKPELYPLAFLCLTVPIFLISILSGKALNTLTKTLISLPSRKKSRHHVVEEHSPSA